MADDRKPRPVSGEIMAGSQPSPSPVRDQGEDALAIDADFETITATSPRDDADVPAAPVPAGLESLKPGRDALRSQRGGAVFWSVGGAAVLLAFWAAGGHALMETETAQARTERGAHPLRIENVVSRTEMREGRSLLFVDGDARNGGEADHALPAIDIAVTDNDGATQHYRLDTGASKLVPGQRYGFSSRLDAPPTGVRSVSVTFREETR